MHVGQIAETIADRAKKAGCAMIYMGTCGMTAIENMLLGFIAAIVLHPSTSRSCWRTERPRVVRRIPMAADEVFEDVRFEVK